MSTLAPPQQPQKLRKVQPQPAGLRPKKGHPFPVWNLIRVPIRVLSPPKATGMVGSVRSFKSTPFTDVRLADVIANKHLSPLSLKDFEVSYMFSSSAVVDAASHPPALAGHRRLLLFITERLINELPLHLARAQGYLVFREYSAESLYFILWLNEYEKEYTAWANDPNVEHPAQSSNANTDPTAYRTTSHLPDYLSESLRRGLDVFFTPDGPLELNLPHTTRDKVLVEAGNSGNPADFAEARDIIEHSLNRSLATHAKSCTANAGPRRLVFCFCLGLSVFCLGLIPMLVGIL